MEQETVFWESVRDSDQITDVQAYLDQYPNGRFAALARNRIRRLRNATDTQPDKLEPSRMKLDLAFWQSIKGSQTSGDYEAYLVQFPNGQFARLARARIATAALELEETARFAREAAETKRAASKGTEGVALAPSIQDDNSQERKDTTNDRAIEAKILEQVYVFFHTVVWSQENWNSVGRKKQQRSASIGRQAHRMKLQSWTAVVVQTISRGARHGTHRKSLMQRREPLTSAWTFALRRNLPASVSSCTKMTSKHSRSRKVSLPDLPRIRLRHPDCVARAVT